MRLSVSTTVSALEYDLARNGRCLLCCGVRGELLRCRSLHVHLLSRFHGSQHHTNVTRLSGIESCQGLVALPGTQTPAFHVTRAGAGRVLSTRVNTSTRPILSSETPWLDFPRTSGAGHWIPF